MASPGSTHQLINIKEIKDNVVVLTNNSLRSVLMVSSLNFALKSQMEQEAIIARFQDLVNSLDFTVQILIQSRKLDIAEYLNFINERAALQTSELLKIQAAEYASFIEELVKLSNIMSKFFYVIVPVGQSAAAEASGFLAKIFSSRKKTEAKSSADLGFETAVGKLNMRTSRVTELLGSMGLRTVPLNQEELIELFYTGYNPGLAPKQRNLEQLIATGDEAKQIG